MRTRRRIKDSAVENQELLNQIRQKDETISSLQQDRLARETMIRMLIHDLKGPLGTIMASLDLLGLKRLHGAQQDIVHTALQGCQELFSMIQNLLQIGKMEGRSLDLNLSMVDVRAFLQEMKKKVEISTDQKEIQLDIDCEFDRIIALDADLVHRMIYNLLFNAIAHTPEGGRIVLGASESGNQPRMRIWVKDNGIGIPKSHQQAVFDLYRRLRAGHSNQELYKAYGGSIGIGLAFCKLAAKQHQGRIWVESRPGEGSLFVVELPTDLAPMGSGWMASDKT